jgi:hypothetical protein
VAPSDSTGGVCFHSQAPIHRAWSSVRDFQEVENVR